MLRRRHVGLLAAVVFAPAVEVNAQTAAPQRAPVPRTVFEGPTLDFDFPGMLVGTAEYDEGPTGVTVFYFPNWVKAVVDVRGGAPGTVNTDALRLGYNSEQMNVVVLSGGSWHGLSAVTGAADEIRSMRTDSTNAPRIQGAVGAIINDLGIGASRRRFSAATPDATLGRAALRAARPGRFYLGARGGGRFAMSGGAFGMRETSGQGAAFRQIGPTKIAVFTVVNAYGSVVDREGRIVRCRQMHWSEQCGRATDRISMMLDSIARRSTTAFESSHGEPSDNTTISLIVTNQKMDWAALNRLAVQVHTSFARAIQPFATAGDGDVLYAVTTDEVENPRLSAGELALAASEVAWDAILASVPRADALIDPSPRPFTGGGPIDRFAGVYELGPGTRVTVTADGGKLSARCQNCGLYLAPGRENELLRVGANDFMIAGPRRDLIRFGRDNRQRITSFTINPGNWSHVARRK